MGGTKKHRHSPPAPATTTTTTATTPSTLPANAPQHSHHDHNDEDHSVNSFNSLKSHHHEHSHGTTTGGHGHSHSHGNPQTYNSYQTDAIRDDSTISIPPPSFSHQQYEGRSSGHANMHSHVVCSHTQLAPDCGHNECQPLEDPKRASSQRVLRIVTILCFTFMCIELLGGYLSGSLAIMTDAAHLLSDLVSFMISLMSIAMASKSPNSSMTFGYHRAEILGALTSVFLIWALTVVLVYESINRIINPHLINVNAKMMLIVAILGFIVNIIMGLVLLLSGEGHNHSHGGLPSSHGHSHDFGGHDDEEGEDHGHSHSHGHGHSHGHDSDSDNDNDEHGPLVKKHGHGHHGNNHHNDHAKKSGIIDRVMEFILPTKSKRSININAAVLHVLGDLMQSVGVIFAALIIWFNPNWKLADPFCTLLFSVIVITTTMRVMKQGVRVLMEGTPDGIDSHEVAGSLQNIPSVIAVHDLHIWSLSVDQPALAVHLVVAFRGDDESTHDMAETPEDVLNQVNTMLSSKYQISHTTIQLEEQYKTGVCVPKSTLCKRPSVGEISPL